MENSKQINNKTELQSEDLIQVTGGNVERQDLYDPAICAKITYHLDFRCDTYVNGVRSTCSNYRCVGNNYYTRYWCEMGRFDITVETNPDHNLGK